VLQPSFKIAIHAIKPQDENQNRVAGIKTADQESKPLAWNLNFRPGNQNRWPGIKTARQESKPHGRNQNRTAGI
jgi:hypothetical protein